MRYTCARYPSVSICVIGKPGYSNATHIPSLRSVPGAKDIKEVHERGASATLSSPLEVLF